MLLMLLLLGACGPAAPATELPGMPFMVTLTPGKQSVLIPLETPTRILVTEPPALPGLLPTATLAATALPVTLTANPTHTQVLPTPTETLLPPLELPTEKPRAPDLVAWTGLPTYLGDSDPGLLFRVDYDPDHWAQTEGNFGDIVLGNRQIEYCTITPWSGRGLPADWKVVHEFRYIGSAAFDVNTVIYQDVVKFVSYVGGDRHVLTGFQVSFNEQQDKCLQEAEIIFGTLRSFAAVPTATPAVTSLPEMLPSPVSANLAVSATPRP